MFKSVLSKIEIVFLQFNILLLLLVFHCLVWVAFALLQIHKLQPYKVHGKTQSQTRQQSIPFGKLSFAKQMLYNV